eukprot:4421574-Heterocapsa_arctica.AAC.1
MMSGRPSDGIPPLTSNGPGATSPHGRASSGATASAVTPCFECQGTPAALLPPQAPCVAPRAPSARLQRSRIRLAPLT